MKTIGLLAVLCLAFTFRSSNLPSVNVKDLEGNTIDFSTISNDGKPIVISFWATWCAPCKRELNAIHELYPDWQDETGVKLVAVSIDDSRTAARVKPYVDAQAWDYEVYLDENGDLKRQMNVQNVPHTFLINGEGEIVFQHNNYSPGDEDELYEKIKSLVE